MSHTPSIFPRLCPFGLAALLVGGCGEAPVEPNVLPDPDAPRTTFYGEVAPLLADACGSCHAEGGVAPMTFDTYEDAVHWAPAIKAAVDNRTMPPFNVNNDGSCATYADARWLGEEEIARIDAWVAEGTPEGDASLGMPEPPAMPRLEGDNLMTLQGPADYLPATEGFSFAQSDDYQCFLVDPELGTDKFLTGYDVHPGNDAVVHHVIGFNVDLDREVLIPGQGLTTNRALIETLDAESPDVPGWDCYSAAGEGVMIEGVPVTWAPGAGATKFPKGTGIRLAEQEVMVLQVHYNLLEYDGRPDSTTVELQLSDEVEREARMLLADGFLMTLLEPEPATLPVGLPDAAYEWSMSMDELRTSQDLGDLDEVEVLGVLPHMHERGKTMSVEFGDARSCGARVDRWDFAWQQAYFLEDPIRTRVDEPMHVRCTFDTRDATEPVGPGFGTGDEMCLVGVYIAPPA